MSPQAIDTAVTAIMAAYQRGLTSGFLVLSAADGSGGQWYSADSQPVLADSEFRYPLVHDETDLDVWTGVAALGEVALGLS